MKLPWSKIHNNLYCNKPNSIFSALFDLSAASEVAQGSHLLETLPSLGFHDTIFMVSFHLNSFSDNFAGSFSCPHLYALQYPRAQCLVFLIYTHLLVSSLSDMTLIIIYMLMTHIAVSNLTIPLNSRCIYPTAPSYLHLDI